QLLDGGHVALALLRLAEVQRGAGLALCVEDERQPDDGEEREQGEDNDKNHRPPLVGDILPEGRGPIAGSRSREAEHEKVLGIVPGRTVMYTGCENWGKIICTFGLIKSTAWPSPNEWRMRDRSQGQRY